MQRNDPSKLDIMKIIDVICIVFISRENQRKEWISSVFDFGKSSSSSSLSVSIEIVASPSSSFVPAKRILICGSPGRSEWTDSIISAGWI